MVDTKQLPDLAAFQFWAPAEELGRVHVEQRLASWEARSHPAQQRMNKYLGDLESCFAPHLVSVVEPLYLQIEVVRPVGTDLLHHYDLENYLTPVAQRLGGRRLVLACAEKRHARGANDVSFVALGVARRAPAPVGGAGYVVHLVGSYEKIGWKQSLRRQLLDCGAREAEPGPLAMHLAWRCRSGRNWVNLWKPAGDALGPILGEPNPNKPFHPRDDRIVRLGMHLAEEVDGNDVEVAVWWAAH